MVALENTLNELVENGIISHVAVRVGMVDEILYDTFRGNVDENTLFDMASVTKVIVTTTLALIGLDKGLISLDDRVSNFYPTEKSITIKNLLTHTMGIGYKNLSEYGDRSGNVVQTILDIPSDVFIGSDVRYSCPGFILLGKILEKVYGKPLNECFDEMVAKPLELENTSFLPKNIKNAVNSNLDQDMLGIVNDYNCQFLGGVAGNAGLFSNLSDVTNYVYFLLNKGRPLISEDAFLMAVQNYTLGMSESRGLGFLYVDDRYKQTGGLFAEGTIGHCGHTGQSVFVDYRSGLYAIILSDATVSTMKKYGKEHYNEVIEMRSRLHGAIKQDLNGRGMIF